MVIFNKMLGEHVEAVPHLFTRAAEHDVSLNTKKAEVRAADGKARRTSGFGEPLQSTLSNRPGYASRSVISLLKKDYLWVWTTAHSDAFTNARLALYDLSDLAFYDPSHPTALHVDAFLLHGLGFVLKQKKAGGQWKMIQAGSRFLFATETRYAMIELECLGAT